MCAPCKRKHKDKLVRERDEMKRRRLEREAMMQRLAQQANGQVTTEEHPTPDQIPEIRQTDLPPFGTAERMQVVRDIKDGKVTYKRALTPEQEVEMLDAYTKTDEPIGRIAQRYGVRATYPYNVLDRAGVTWRRDHTQTFDEWQAEQARPKETEPVTEQRVLPPEIEAMRNVHPIERGDHGDIRIGEIEAVIRDLPPVHGFPTWEIEYTGRIRVSAASIDEALAGAREAGHAVEITSARRL